MTDLFAVLEAALHGLERLDDLRLAGRLVVLALDALVEQLHQEVHSLRLQCLQPPTDSRTRCNNSTVSYALHTNRTIAVIIVV